MAWATSLSALMVLYSVGHFMPGLTFFILSYYLLRRNYPYLALLPVAPYFLCYDSFYSIVDNFTSLSAIGLGIVLWIAAYQSSLP
ncbi:MAG: hypothetical protein NZ933_06145 [Bacteroidia bacterium]|nr:hypothetical protein [Bacteroidia bacterium]